MKILIPTNINDYKLLDSGVGLRLEQFGENIILRPDSTCLWRPNKKSDLWNSVSAEFKKLNQNDRSYPSTSSGRTTLFKNNPIHDGFVEPNERKQRSIWTWYKQPSFKEPWLFSYQVSDFKKITLQLRLSQSKNIGIFPEQASNWNWMTKIIKSINYQPNILNLFAYTGAATLCAAASGAQVCHVDASHAAINWARNNQRLSNLETTPIRWIVDDCLKFVTREIKRNVKYDGLILDPPAFGRDPRGKIFEFEKEIIKLLSLCKQVLKSKPLFIIFNGYAMGHSATILKNLLQNLYPQNSIEFGELHLQEFEQSRTLPCSIFSRFSNI